MVALLAAPVSSRIAVALVVALTTGTALSATIGREAPLA
ncbi:hypothetical protein FraEuI1c_0912 [Pseudofrankia inefficax]|uniref:Uncharacterized protein n=1 Tax=Pseudofrankia inefficax (strain DSM 45817 / CECT 9037 / DDB 130130 / EuI1c) TaxID=298654 RepID=E3IXG9_PSEI1|nr:hypothetical protein FraEuI1c_0912 [Pseudofrankia inefficax]